MVRDLANHLSREQPKNIPEKTRQLVLERDNHQCQLCGTSGENRLQLHHLQYRSQGGSHAESNLVTLCFRCHEEVHRGDADILLIQTAQGDWATFPGARRPKRST